MGGLRVSKCRCANNRHSTVQPSAIANSARFAFGLVPEGTGSWGAGSFESDARWRPRYGDFWRFTPYLYGQFFTGYGETLLSYDRSHSAIRVGIGFTDRSTRGQ